MRSARACSVALTNRREIVDLLVEVATAVTCSPTGSRPSRYRREDSPPSICSIALRPNSSVPVNASYEATGNSLEAPGDDADDDGPSTARTLGRRTGTRRPPRVTDPASVPCRVAARSGSCLPRGPHNASTSAAIIAAITCSPAPTARASSPSRTSAAISSITTLTTSGTTGTGTSPRTLTLVRAVFFWKSLLTAVPRLGCLGRRPRSPLGRAQAGDRHLNFHDTRGNLCADAARHRPLPPCLLTT